MWVPIAATVSIVVLAAALPLAIFLTAITIQWIAFLVGVLVAASLALASRASRSRWLIARRDSQLRSVRARLAKEIAARIRANDLLAALYESTSGRTVLVEQSVAPSVVPPRRMAAQGVAHFGDRGEVPRVVVTAPADTVAITTAGLPAATAVGSDPIAEAIAQDDFSLYLQKVARINAGSTAPEFHQALLRFDGEEEYHLPPGTFLAQAEDCGMLPALDAWQVRHAVEWMGADPSRRLQTCGINISAATLAGGGFLAVVRAALREHRVSGECLCLGIDADELDERLPEVAQCVRELKREGCHIAVTGFGRGRASMKALHEVAPDYVKLDAGLVLGLSSQSQATKLAAIIRIAHAAGASTVAECVDDEETLASLLRLGVDFAQGKAIAASFPLGSEHTSTSPATRAWGRDLGSLAA